MSVARAASQWVYEGVWGVLTGLFRVPREAPQLPGLSGEKVVALRPCDGWLSYRKTLFWLACLIVDIALGVAWLLLLAAQPPLALVLLAPWLIVMIVPDIFAYIAVYLRYDSTWYVLSDRSMRIRRGVWIIYETTITYENIQNVRVTQGPLQRLFGFSDLVVETAGGGGSGKGEGASLGGHVGILEGVADPAALRDQILDRARLSRSTGLGDDAPRRDFPAQASGWTSAHVRALRTVAHEAARLRATICPAD
ncbi:MAG: PH domain-containing protein [Planctomycetota bacterium]|nr:PH domain-containing protein [Planctomycetota bacterium]